MRNKRASRYWATLDRQLRNARQIRRENEQKTSSQRSRMDLIEGDVRPGERGFVHPDANTDYYDTHDSWQE